MKHLYGFLLEIDGGTNGIGKGLSIGTCQAIWNLRMGGPEVDDARQKDPLHPFFKEINDMAMADFDRETGFSNHILDSFPDQLFMGGIR